MARSPHPVLVIVHALLLLLGLLTMSVGMVGFMEMNKLWWAFALMTVAGAMVFGGSIQKVRAWSKGVYADESEAHQMRAAARAGEVAPAAPGTRSATPVLAHWTYAPGEWRDYVDGELRYALRAAAAGAAGIVLLATVLLGLVDHDWERGFVMGVALSVGIIGSGLTALWLEYRRDRAVTAGEVIVGPRAMLVNGRYEALHDGGRVLFTRALVRDAAAAAVLVVEFTVSGDYRRKPFDCRVPIPAGREDEARAVAEALNRLYPALPVAAAAALPG